MEGKVQSTAFCGGQRPHSSLSAVALSPQAQHTRHMHQHGKAGVCEIWSPLLYSRSEGRGN